MAEGGMPMPITLVPLAAEHAQALPGLVAPEEADLIVANPNVLRYRAVLDGDTCVGMVGLKLLGEHPEIVVATADGQRQKGYATAAVREMVRYAFDVIGLPGVYAKCLTGRPSNKVVAKTGFTFVMEQGQERYYELRKVNWEAAQ
jgi:RimJ/RimL family protein N-acetyltransferase